MDEQLSKIKDQISKIDNLRNVSEWGPEFQLWERATEKLVKEVFGDEGLKLFKQQQTVSFSYLEDGFNQEQYQNELGKRKTILEGLLSEVEESQPKKLDLKNDKKDILKEIWKKEEALKENLLTTEEAQTLHDSLLAHLEKVLPPDSLPGLRFRKLKTGRPQTWWSTNSYPTDKPWPKFQLFLELLAQHEAEKTIKHRFETEGLFVESRSQGEDQHILIGNKDGTGEKAHIILDGKSGEIRVEDNRKEPTELIDRVEAILTLPGGKKIRTTREAVEEIV